MNQQDRPSATASARAPAPRPAPGSEAERLALRHTRRMMLLVLAVCLAPIIASYFTYYVIKPQGGSTNYGTLIEPQRAIPSTLTVRTEDGVTMPLSAVAKGKWRMVSVDSSACDVACVKKLYFMRQIRVTQGAERNRVVTIWLRTDDGPVSDVIRHAYSDTRMLVADPASLDAWLPVDGNTLVADHIYLVDPNGNLMMRFPKNPDPAKIRTDLTKLLKWSDIG